MPSIPLAKGPLVRSIIEGLQYTNGLAHYIPTFLREDGHRPIVKQISADMRSTLPEAVRYIVLITTLQLSDFATEAAQAFQETRPILLPRPHTDIDYTVLRIWKNLNDTTLATYEELSDWKGIEWNPYENLQNALERLAIHIGEKHFGLTTEAASMHAHEKQTESQVLSLVSIDEDENKRKQKRPKVRRHH